MTREGFRKLLSSATLTTAVIVFGLFAVSCIPQKKLLLMQYDEINDSSYARRFAEDPNLLREYLIQPNDYLYVSVMAIEKELSQFMEPMGGINFLNQFNQALIGYYVDDEGYILFPYIGKIYVANMTVRQAQEQVRQAAQKILGERIRIELKLINNYINVLGEVRKEGIYNMTKNRITIYEALTLAGGLTEHAKRNNIKVYRKVDGKPVVYQVDVTSGKLIGDRMFYVLPNDVIYVEPMRSKILGLGPTFSFQLISTLLSTTITVILLIQQINLLAN
ncbi:MAG: polysaccharide biosynthesis/export family protein [Bacteroidetes bacterium]|nr:polysaccharide biosynthesis/export family protein [Bacteroidota bacterium]